MNEREEAARFFEDVINHLKPSEHRDIQDLVDEIHDGYGHDVYDIPIAFNYHIEMGNMFLTTFHGRVAIARSMTCDGEWRWDEH